MNMKKVLAVFSAASALAATQVLPAHAKDCPPFSIPLAPRVCADGTLASGKAGASFTVPPAHPDDNVWKYTWNYTFGPAFPTASASLVNQDGVTFSKNALTGNRCNPVVDGLKGDNVAAEKTCETKATNLPGGAVFLRVTVP